MRVPFASELIAQVAPSLGIAVELEPEFGFAGEMVFPDGRRHLFRNTNFNVNPAGSTEIARDKAYAHHFLRKRGLRVPQGRAFFSDALNAHLQPHRRRDTAAACAYAEALGFPVFAKPNNLSQGALVDKVANAAELAQHLADIFRQAPVALVEVPQPGRDYRVVVLGDEVISVYERRPLAVTGDGVHPVQALLAQAKAGLAGAGRPNAEIDLDDGRIDRKLARAGLTRASVLPAGQALALLDNANLSTGGSSVDITGAIHPTFAALALRATHGLGLRLAGVDFIADDLTADADGQSWVVLEVNPAPGLDNYASLGSEQHARVVGLYRKILLYLRDAAPAAAPHSTAA